jgi:DNA modification methylase
VTKNTVQQQDSSLEKGVHPEPSKFHFPADDRAGKLHSLFRYPAKFHPPIAKELVRLYSNEGDTVLDPFCGSGTLLLEAKIAGRDSIGMDIDPLAAFISKVKTANWKSTTISKAATTLIDEIARMARSDSRYQSLSRKDISEAAYRREVRDHNLWVPSLPRIGHWFRHYVIVDLAKILAVIESDVVPKQVRPFFLLCFASAIRACSNADPVPVSGLEVTSHMKEKEALGRIVNPIELVTKSIRKAVAALDGAPTYKSKCKVINGDATMLSKSVRSPVSACITSPPYHGAVDYYRRHTLEMYWLRLVDGQEDRLSLKPKYIGQSNVPRSHSFLTERFSGGLLTTWEDRIRRVSPHRADAFHHYMVAMKKTFDGLAEALPSGSPAVFVVGKSKWNGSELPTATLLAELADQHFEFAEQFWYPLKNRYMSYSRHNGADIDREFVAVFSRR